MEKDGVQAFLGDSGPIGLEEYLLKDAREVLPLAAIGRKPSPDLAIREGNRFSEYLVRYGNDFSFALLGISVSSFVSTGLDSLAKQVREAQIQGTLEALLVTPTSANMILFGNSLWSFVESFLVSILYLGIAIVIIGLKVSKIMIALVLLILSLTFLALLALVVGPAGFWLLRLSLSRAKRVGSLVQF